MKLTLKKMLALLLALCLCASVMVGCAPKDTADDTKPADTKPADTKPVDTEPEEEPLERVDLVFWLVGDAPADMGKVQDKINEILLEKINATITFNHTTWTDYMQKYNMLLFSGETVDLIYSCNWMNYSGYSMDGAFTALDDLLPTYMPNIYQMGQEQNAWDQMKVDGSIYGVPLFQSEYTNSCLVYRKDLCDKYDLPIPDTLENCEAYLQGIKDNMPDQVLLNPYVQTATNPPFTTYNYLDFFKPDTLGNFNLEFSYDDPNGDYEDYFASEQFKEDCERYKKWADAGYWPKNSVTQQSPGSIEDGGCVMTVRNPAQYMAHKNAAAENHPDWELGVILQPEIGGAGVASLFTTNCTSIPHVSKNPERAAMALELLLTDETLNRLVLYGIQGEHYDIDENGYYVPGPNNEGYIFEGSSAWNLRNNEFKLIRETDQELYEIFERCEKAGASLKYPNVDIGRLFAFVDDNVAAEKAAVQNVLVEYYTPLLAGMVEDVDAGIEELRKQLEVAGLETIREEWVSQWKAFCDANGFD